MPLFNKLIEITKNPYIDNLNYYVFVVFSCIDNIVKNIKVMKLRTTRISVIIHYYIIHRYIINHIT